ncbi:hypothetical protein DFJ58DRAFT_718667 [Suillus subalutaceus]|uniref:uncharacterized protein n=1 Tax=Suillus subalutaceus TaxID=48586 RepID=UPI001B87B3D6|nr:uncharacterized protein DFJ58DRAFT_718667 [Suillus subalutaceus]KAG1838862.1 hypothetical protein DFJ58DRAFT_718667 [Suillus subalutaceus]
MAPEHTKFCNLCKQDLKPRGWTTHCKACEKKAEKQRQNQLVAESIQREDLEAEADHFADTDVSEHASTPRFRVDDIRCEYHPSSGIPPEVHAFEDFKRHPTPLASIPPNKHPWAPFKSRLEFELAELALEACLNNEQTDRLIRLCNRCTSRQEKFTFQTHKDIHDRWETASHRLTGFTQDMISVPYDGTVREFDLHYRNLWEWTTDLLRDPQLFPHMVFDAQRFSKFDGKTFVTFVDEPFWNVQSQLPEGAKPLAFILYADKTKLSLFGTARGYPVIARLANLPTDIRNGQGMGGSNVVGWLPIVKDEKDHAGKPSWVNFKNAVWHKVFLKILSPLASKSSTGQWFECLDSIQRWFFPSILILSADYEQCVMSLTRGIKSLWPCPVCLVPHDNLLDALKTYPRRTSDQLQNILQVARGKQTAEERDDTLKQYGLRDVQNAFWIVRLTCVHYTLSWDRLHFNGGLYRDHLWAELQRLITSLGRASVAQMDHNYKAFPQCISFADSSVYEDISKMVIYAAHIIVTGDECPIGYLLLCSLEVHTADTIRAGRHAVQAFSTYLQQYIAKTADTSDKNWNFPKLHMSVHIFDNIEAKGATCHCNMKPNENMHGPLKDSYQMHTNFRNVQILRINHWQVVSESICRNISDFNEYQLRDANNVLDEDNSVLGSRQAQQTFESVKNTHRHDSAFTNFSIQVPLPGGKRVQLKADDKITECRFLKVNYESLVDWRQHTDFLHCNPKFFGAPRFDCVFVQTTDKIIFGRLLFVFGCTLENTAFSLALIHPFDTPTGVRIRKDKHLSIFCAEFFSVRSIIRGAFLVLDGSTSCEANTSFQLHLCYLSYRPFPSLDASSQLHVTGHHRH